MSAMSTASTMAGGATGNGSSRLGQLVTSRGQSGFGRVVTVGVLGVLAVGCAIGVVVAGLAVVRGTWAALAGVLVASGMCALCVVGIRGAFRTLRFYEGGVVEELGPRRREILYEDVDRVSYGITRQYVNGVYAGTMVNMQLRTADGRKMGYAGRYKEKPKGWAMTVFGRSFEGSDELDVIRDVVAAHVAERLTDQIARGEAVDWPGCGTITADGISPARGRRKGGMVPWAEFAGMSMDKGVLHLFAHGDKKSFLDVAMGAVNVFPVVALVGTLSGTAGSPPEGAAG